MARKILDDAWPRYAQALPTIERGKANLLPPPAKILDSVASLLQADVPVRAKLKLLLFVGGFDNEDGIPTVALLVEGTGAALILTHVPGWISRKLGCRR